MSKRLRLILIGSILSLLFLGLCFIPFIAFNAITSSVASMAWLIVTHSGGALGVPVIILFICFIIGWQFKGWRKKMLSISLSLVIISLLLGLVAKTNEAVIKERLKVQRPNIEFLATEHAFNAEAFYSLVNKGLRRSFLENYLQQVGMDNITFRGKSIEPIVLDHWIVETGYSFPSGHSTNAFLMACILGYLILFIYEDYRRSLLFPLPFIWALGVGISRVVLGVHRPIDVVSGAFIGILLGILLLSTGIIDRYLKQKKASTIK